MVLHAGRAAPASGLSPEFAFTSKTPANRRVLTSADCRLCEALSKGGEINAVHVAVPVSVRPWKGFGEISIFRTGVTFITETVRIEVGPADAGYDSEPNDVLLREEHGIRSTIPPKLVVRARAANLPVLAAD